MPIAADIRRVSIQTSSLRAKRLNRLSELAEQRARHMLLSLQRAEAEVSHMQTQREELQRFARGYQQSQQDAEAVLPSLFQSRQRFIGNLQREIEHIDERMRVARLQLQPQYARYQRLAGEAMAIASMADRVATARELQDRRQEQLRLDEIGGNRFFRQTAASARSAAHRESIEVKPDD